jgi:hypothetical protein
MNPQIAARIAAVIAAAMLLVSACEAISVANARTPPLCEDSGFSV